MSLTQAASRKIKLLKPSRREDHAENLPTLWGAIWLIVTTRPDQSASPPDSC